MGLGGLGPFFASMSRGPLLLLGLLYRDSDKAFDNVAQSLEVVARRVDFYLPCYVNIEYVPCHIVVGVIMYHHQKQCIIYVMMYVIMIKLI